MKFNRTLDINTRIPLWEFCERFVAHNTTVYLYEEEVYLDEEGDVQQRIYPIEEVMDWQIALDYEESSYFRCHPEVRKSKYSHYNVVKAINSFEDPCHVRIDCVALVVEK